MAISISADLFRANVAAGVSGLGDPFVAAAGPGGQVAGEVSTVIPVDIIRLDVGAQMRAALDPATIRAYADRMLAGDVFPALTVVYDGLSYFLADGFHRLAALGLLAGEWPGGERWRAVAVSVVPGDARRAILLAAGANASHGLPRKPEDKRRAVAALLADREWLQWSDNEIARVCVVSPPFVAKLRRELHGGAGEQTGGEVRRGADGRAISVANIGRVAAIGAASPARAVAFSPVVESGSVSWRVVGEQTGGQAAASPARAGQVAGERLEIPIRPAASAAPVVGVADFERVIDSGLAAALVQAIEFGRSGLLADGRAAALAASVPHDIGEDLQAAAAALASAAGRALLHLHRAAAVAGVDLAGGEVGS